MSDVVKFERMVLIAMGAALAAVLGTVVVLGDVTLPKMCSPNVGETERQVIRACGQPQSKYDARWKDGVTIRSEYVYEAVIVGLSDGAVAYVLAR
jgi:hypothetical protein